MAGAHPGRRPRRDVLGRVSRVERAQGDLGDGRLARRVGNCARPSGWRVAGTTRGRLLEPLVRGGRGTVRRVPRRGVERRRAVPVSGLPLLVEGSALPVLIVGGGAVAVRKASTLAASGARVRVVALSAAPEMRALAEAGHVTLDERRYEATDV